MKIAAITLVTDSRFDLPLSWLRNSMSKTNPDLELIVVDLTKGIDNWDFSTWHNETLDHPLRKDNTWGIVKYMTALQVIEEKKLDAAIMLGADVIVCNKWEVPDVSDFIDILTTYDISQYGWQKLNPDVQIVYGTKFLKLAIDEYKKQLELYDVGDESFIREYSLDIYGEMSMLNWICQNDLVNSTGLHNLIENSNSPLCFNMNVRRSDRLGLIHSHVEPFKMINGVLSFDDTMPIVSLHVQCGLGTITDTNTAEAKLKQTLTQSPFLIDKDVRNYIQYLCEDFTIFE